MNLQRETRGLMYQFYKLFKSRMPEPNPDVTIDVVIPVLEKDLKVLPLCLEGVRRCVNHRIGQIFLVAPRSEAIVRFCDDNGLTYVEESSVLGYSPKEIGFITAQGQNRSGWLFQQFIKLSGKLGDNRYYLVIDADHVLLRPHTFLTKDNHTLFYRSTEYHLPYYDNIRRLTGIGSGGFFSFSYVTHKMLFDKEALTALRNELEKRNGAQWDKAILDSLDRSGMSPFSEFELYGHFMPAEKKTALPWRTKSMSYAGLATYDELVKRYGKKYLAVTFPDYYN